MKTKITLLPVLLSLLFLNACEVQVDGVTYDITPQVDPPKPTDSWTDKDYIVCRTAGAHIPEQWMEVSVSKVTYLTSPGFPSSEGEAMVVAPDQLARHVEIKRIDLNGEPVIKTLFSETMAESKDGSVVVFRDHRNSMESNSLRLMSESKEKAAMLILEGDMAFALTCGVEPTLQPPPEVSYDNVECRSLDEKYLVSVSYTSPKCAITPEGTICEAVEPQHTLSVKDASSAIALLVDVVNPRSDATFVVYQGTKLKLKLSNPNDLKSFPGDLEGFMEGPLSLSCTSGLNTSNVTLTGEDNPGVLAE